MEPEKTPMDLILKALGDKASLKIDVYNKTEEAFNNLKNTLRSIESDLNQSVSKIDKRVAIKFTEKGPFDLELKISDDILIFTMHSDIFTFQSDHQIWKNSYVDDNQQKTYCGIISVYNFITDSFKYNRVNDLGYLIARIFINFENHFFVEGKRQLGFLYNDFQNDLLTPDRIRSVVESAILYSLNFDIYTPSFDQVKVITVQEVIEKNIAAAVSTGKRLGFKFQSDSDLIE